MNDTERNAIIDLVHEVRDRQVLDIWNTGASAQPIIDAFDALVKELNKRTLCGCKTAFVFTERRYRWRNEDHLNSPAHIEWIVSRQR